MAGLDSELGQLRRTSVHLFLTLPLGIQMTWSQGKLPPLGQRGDFRELKIGQSRVEEGPQARLDHF